MSHATREQITANRANAQLSTGPKTESGKAKSSVNAVKSALTGRVILIPTDDVAAYERHVQSLIDVFRPATYEEGLLVQSLADIDWRLRRIPTLESGLYAIGRRELEAENDMETDPQLHEAIILAQIMLKFKRDFNNLSIQETRLRRMREKDFAVLVKIQAERKEAEPEPGKTLPASAVALLIEACKAQESLDLSQIGFDFANRQLAVQQPPSALEKAA